MSPERDGWRVPSLASAKQPMVHVHNHYWSSSTPPPPTVGRKRGKLKENTVSFFEIGVRHPLTHPLVPFHDLIVLDATAFNMCFEIPVSARKNVEHTCIHCEDTSRDRT